jgi:hypothetical protein
MNSRIIDFASKKRADQRGEAGSDSGGQPLLSTDHPALTRHFYLP